MTIGSTERGMPVTKRFLGEGELLESGVLFEEVGILGRKSDLI